MDYVKTNGQASSIYGPYLCLDRNVDGFFSLDTFFRLVGMVAHAYISSSNRDDRYGHSTHVPHIDRPYHRIQHHLHWPASMQCHILDRLQSGNQRPLRWETLMLTIGWALVQICFDLRATVAQHISVQFPLLARLKIVIVSLENLYDAPATVYSALDTHRVFVI